MAEGARLESVYAGNRIVGSNPTPSATLPGGPGVSLGEWCDGGAVNRPKVRARPLGRGRRRRQSHSLSHSGIELSTRPILRTSGMFPVNRNKDTPWFLVALGKPHGLGAGVKAKPG